MASSAPRAGFTLVELLIVVIVLGVIAGIVIPRFETPLAESKEAALLATLAEVREVLELYHVQHDESWPTALADQLTNSTDAAGDTSGTGYGPYFLTSFPDNPVAQEATVLQVATMPGAATGTTGWIYATGDGEFRANSTGTAPSGTDWFDL